MVGISFDGASAANDAHRAYGTSPGKARPQPPVGRQLGPWGFPRDSPQSPAPPSTAPPAGMRSRSPVTSSPYMVAGQNGVAGCGPALCLAACVVVQSRAAVDEQNAGSCLLRVIAVRHSRQAVIKGNRADRGRRPPEDSSRRSLPARPARTAHGAASPLRHDPQRRAAATGGVGSAVVASLTGRPPGRADGPVCCRGPVPRRDWVRSRSTPSARCGPARPGSGTTTASTRTKWPATDD